MNQFAKFLIAAIATANIMSIAWAQDAPVIDLNQSSQTTSPTEPDTTTDQPPSRDSLSDKERLRLLEQQMSNLTQMNLPAKIDNLEQQIQQLNGQLEVQAHNIQTLMNQHNSTSSAADNTTPTTTTTTPADQIANAETNVTQNTASAQNAAIAANVASADSEEKAYQRAFDLLTEQKTAAAITAFQAFLKAYPNGTYAPNAYYWLGELYDKQGNTDLALKQFNTVIQQYPKNAKVPDAMYRSAIIQDGLGQHDAAKQLLQQLTKQFPNSAASRMATIRLQQMSTTPSETPAGN